MNLSSRQQSFILHFGEMGSRWGINRTVSQIYALLYVHEAPLTADQITEALSMSRSNVSMGLKELQSWRLTRLQHLPGDRREYFTTPEDIWDILQILVEERRKREIDPTMSMLRAALMDDPSATEHSYSRKRMQDMLELLELVTGWLHELSELDRNTMIKLMKLGGGIKKLVKPARSSQTAAK